MTAISDIKARLDKGLRPLLDGIDASNRHLTAQDYVTALRAILNEYHKSGLGGYDFAVVFSDYMDLLLRALYALSAFNRDDAFTLVAVGGYGRGELNAYSDIDLLFLYKDTLSEGFQNSILYPLWDTKLEIGHSSRTVDECIDDAALDPTLLTSLMDQRYLAGNRGLFDALHERLYAMVRSTPADFFHAREKELSLRRIKYSTPVYTLEPNIKEGPGGLRDVHCMLWLTRLFSDVSVITQFRDSPFFDADTYARFIDGYNVLMRLRNEMHFLSGSKNDRLTLDVQKHLSTFLGYENEEEVLGVEKFLSDFYEIAHRIAGLTDDYVRYLKETHIISGSTEPERTVETYYRVRHNQMTLAPEHADVYAAHPEELINTFVLLVEQDVKPGIGLKNGIRKAVSGLQEDGRIGVLFPAFLALFQKNNLSKILFLMNDYDVLGAVIPAFKTIAYRVQYDMYHIYTVGIHSIKTVEEIEKITDGGEGTDRFLQSLYRKVRNKPVLLLAAFLHDIGKGHGKDHARRGSEMAYEIATGLGMPRADAELVSFIVRNHLVLSDTAQRRDINDEKLIYEFSKLVKRRENLKMLYLLTVADLRAVSSSVWSEWKGSLIHELYMRSEEALEQGLDMARLTTEKYQLTREMARERLRGKADDSIIDEFLDGFKSRYFTTYSIQEIVEHFDLINRLKADGLLSVSGTVNAQLGYTKISVCTTDRPGIFSVIAGVLSATGANIIT